MHRWHYLKPYEIKGVYSCLHISFTLEYLTKISNCDEDFPRYLNDFFFFFLESSTYTISASGMYLSPFLVFLTCDNH